MLLRLIVALMGVLPFGIFGHGIVTDTDQQTFEAILEGGGHVQIATSSPIVLTQSIDTANFTALPTHTLTVLVQGEGTTSPSGVTQVNSGETVTLTATPSPGWFFDGWSNGPAFSGGQIIVTNDITVMALFSRNAEPVYTVEVNTSGSGTTGVSPNPGPYVFGQPITLTAIPQAGAQFTGWSCSIVSSDNPITFTVHSNLSITANFTTLTTNSFTIYWQNQNGQLAQWNAGLGGLGQATLLNLPVPGNGWQVVATADSNNDNSRELLWMNPDGRLAVWRLNSDNTLSNAALINLRADAAIWKPIAYSDLDADGDADILWVNQLTGNLAIWHLNNLVEVANAALLPTSATGPNWMITDVTRIDDDNHLDILWQQKSTGRLAVWYMNGLAVREAVILNTMPVGTQWTAVDIDDLNGDGTKDILWQSNTTGELAFWLLNPGLAMTTPDPARAFLLPGNIRPGTAWKVIGLSTN